jgi:signal transduction histidine kinase
MRSVFCFFLVLGISHCGFAQQRILDSLRMQLINAKNEDTSQVLALSDLADYFGFVQFDSSLSYSTRAFKLSKKLKYLFGGFRAYRSKFFAFNCSGNYPMALDAALNLQKISDQFSSKARPLGVLAGPYYFTGVLYRQMEDYPRASAQLHQAIHLFRENKQPLSECFYAFSHLGLLYASLNQMDSALWYAQEGYDLGLKTKGYKKFFSLAIGALGNIHVALHHYKLAEELFRQGISQSSESENIYFEARNYNNLASAFANENLRDSCIYYARIGLQLCRDHNFGEFTLDASTLLTRSYELEGNSDSTLKYMRIMLAAKDSVFSQSKGQQFRQFAFDEIQRVQRINADKERYETRIKLYILVSVMSFFLVLAFILYRNNLQKQKAKTKIEKAYADLKATQLQLIQSEKMASLGELTAGIAHEIQNPLNFVNNFSEVNKELSDELESEIDKGNYEGAKAIAKDIKENEEKINHHGKRADSIVKGMLQHSRTISGQKEPTDINNLADEYLRLAYHGLRAKDKSFNAKFETKFNPAVGKINIVPEEIGRVLLNLINNAFYAVSERRKVEGESYEPIVSVSTKKITDKIEIKITDNGNGIPQKVLDKIFQPFFTTKPTGEGTGLGLSLAYDIVKAHGGEIKVKTSEMQGSEFTIQLPAIA